MLFLMLIGLAGTVNLVNAQETYSFATKWGTPGSGDGQFSGPMGVAVDSAGNVFVADNYNYRIQKFDNYGNFLTKWGTPGSGDGQFGNGGLWNGPNGIAVDAAGNVYVADTGNSRIQKFSSSGVFLAKWGSPGIGDGQFNIVYGVTVDTDGNVYVADYGNDRVQKFSNSGVFLAKWGISGSGDGQFSGPHDVAVDSAGNVYVADLFNNRIQKFTSNGGFLTKWGNQGTGDGQFHYPVGVALDTAGNVYVADNYNSRVQKFDSNGNFLTKWGSQGSGDGQFNYFGGVAVDSARSVYVVDWGNSRVQKFSLQWSCSLTAAIGSYYDDSFFGTQVGSTAGFDEACDAVDPPAPPAGVDSYFVGSDQMKLSTNLVSPATDMPWSYRVKSVGASGSMQLFWSAASVSSIPEDYFVLLLNSNGIPVADMRKTAQYVFTVASDVVYSFSVVVLSARTVSLDLNAGWNMVSFPVLPSDTSFASIFSGKGYYQVLTWTGTSYVTASNVEVGRGYWVLVLSPTSLSLIGAPMTSFGVDLQSGWSMIGSVYGRTVGGGTVFSGYYQLVSWNGATYVDSKSVGIEPLKGYWALVLTPTHITVG